MNKKILIVGSVLGFLAVVLGAFAAHGLENSITKDAIETFQTGVRYQMYHAIVLLFVGGTTFLSAKTKKWMYYFVVLGVLLFSGSIYGLATNELTSFDFKTIGFVTPIGGLFLIISWVLMLIDFIKFKS
ncbi:MAG: DUF423 domain-containing protein [Chlorobi bacterium]|nr:DUF423 domain-containing protein [Chlorobiota bacterium]